MTILRDLLLEEGTEGAKRRTCHALGLLRRHAGHRFSIEIHRGLELGLALVFELTHCIRHETLQLCHRLTFRLVDEVRHLRHARERQPDDAAGGEGKL